MPTFQLQVTVPETGALSIVPPDFLRGQTVVVRLENENTKNMPRVKDLSEMSPEEIAEVRRDAAARGIKL